MCITDVESIGPQSVAFGRNSNVFVISARSARSYAALGLRSADGDFGLSANAAAPCRSEIREPARPTFVV